MISQPYQLYVERIDATRNMARFYALSIEPTLFGEACLVRRWGRIGSRGRTVIEHYGQEKDAVVAFLDLLRRKRQRGYRTLSARLRGSTMPQSTPISGNSALNVKESERAVVVYVASRDEHDPPAA